MAVAFMAAETINSKTQSKRKMFIDCELLHIDESIFYPWDKEHEVENRKRLEAFAAENELKLNVVSLGEKYKLSEEDSENLIAANSDRGSCREDTVSFFRNNAIQDFASKHGYEKVMVGDNGLRVSLL